VPRGRVGAIIQAPIAGRRVTVALIDAPARQTRLGATTLRNACELKTKRREGAVVKYASCLLGRDRPAALRDLDFAFGDRKELAPLSPSRMSSVPAAASTMSAVRASRSNRFRGSPAK
jgi:hypothetical protein